MKLGEVLEGRGVWRELWSFRDELRDFGEKGSPLCYYIGEVLENLLKELAEAEIDVPGEGKWRASAALSK